MALHFHKIRLLKPGKNYNPQVIPLLQCYGLQILHSYGIMIGNNFEVLQEGSVIIDMKAYDIGVWFYPFP